MKDEVFNNTSRRVIRVFLAIAAGFALVAAVPLLVLWFQSFRGGASVDTRQSCLLTVWLTSPLMLAMLFSALLTIPTARQADREFDLFRGGDLLIRWEYSLEFWLPYVEAETQRLRSVSKVMFGLIFGPVTVLGLYIGYLAAQTARNRIEVCAIVVAAVCVLALVYIVAATAVVRFRRNALLNCPRAYIGRSAVYCGGIFNFWGSQMRGLQSVRLLPGHAAEHPGLIEFVIGWSPGARRAAAAIDAVTLLAMRPAYVSSQSARQVIPIPPGEESHAAEVVAMLGSPARVASPVEADPSRVLFASAAPVALPAAARAKKPPALSGAHHDPQTLRRKAIRWLGLTLVLLFGGLALFLLAMPLDYDRPAGTEHSSLATGIEVAGLFAWMVSPATLIMGALQWFRLWRSSRNSNLKARIGAR